MDVADWIEIIIHNAKTHKWPDSFTISQALNKLKGTAKTWYDTFIQSEKGWSRLTWANWKKLLLSTFQSNRNIHELFMEVVNHKPNEGCSLYDFHFQHLAILNKLKLNFSDADKVSMVIGAINDSTIKSAVEAANITNPNILANYLKNKTYTPLK